MCEGAQVLTQVLEAAEAPDYARKLSRAEWEWAERLAADILSLPMGPHVSSTHWIPMVAEVLSTANLAGTTLAALAGV